MDDIETMGPRIRKLEKRLELMFKKVGEHVLGLNEDDMSAEERIAKANGEDPKAMVRPVSREEFDNLLDTVRQIGEQVQAAATQQTTSLAEMRQSIADQKPVEQQPSIDSQIQDHVDATATAQPVSTAVTRAGSESETKLKPAEADDLKTAQDKEAATGTQQLPTRANNGPADPDHPLANLAAVENGIDAKNGLNPSGAREAMSAEFQAPEGSTGTGSNGRPTLDANSVTAQDVAAAGRVGADASSSSEGQAKAALENKTAS